MTNEPHLQAANANVTSARQSAYASHIVARLDHAGSEIVALRHKVEDLEHELESRIAKFLASGSKLSAQELFDGDSTNNLTAQAGPRGLIRKIFGRHSRVSGRESIRSLSDNDLAEVLVDPRWYLSKYPDVADAKFDPVDHFAKFGLREGRSPSTGFDVERYTAMYPDVVAAGVNPLRHFIGFGFWEDRLTSDSVRVLSPREWLATSRTRLETIPIERLPILYIKHVEFSVLTSPDVEIPASADSSGPETSIRRIGMERLGFGPRWFQVVKNRPPSVNIITDSIAGHSFFGGVSTALIFGAAVANRLGWPLRILTRDGSSIALCAKFMNDLGLYDTVQLSTEQQREDGRDVALVSSKDFYLTTSWWSTRSVFSSPAEGRITYLIQEDERLFYPSGDLSLAAETVMNDESITRIVNSRSLLHHLSNTGITFKSESAQAFSPSFSYQRMLREIRSKKPVDAPITLLFYARPQHVRNLYWTGLAALDQFLSETDAHIDLRFTGSPTDSVPKFSNDSTPSYLGQLTWSGYLQELLKVDVLFSLMASPHPSYPPLDALAVGCGLVTNTWSAKTNPVDLGSGTFMADPNPDKLVSALGALVDHVIATRKLGESCLGDVAPEFHADWDRQFASSIELVIRSLGL